MPYNLPQPDDQGLARSPVATSDRRFGFFNRRKSSSGTGGGGWRSLAGTIALFLLAPLIALSITAFFFQSYQVDGESMEKTLQNDDRLIIDKIPRTWARITNHDYIPKRGDIIVFNQLGLLDSNGQEEKQLIKRVIGLPGERVVVADGSITIYNKARPDGFNPDISGGYSINVIPTSGNVDLTVPEGAVFVCGDNRSNSTDSRIFGPVDADNIVGKLKLRVFPIANAQAY